MNAKEIARLLGLLKAADPKVVTQMIEDDPTLIGKAHAADLEAPEVTDLRTAGRLHAVPTREEIETGPAQSASGAGAERMIREYSRPARQEGVTTEAMRLADIMEDFSRSMKALVDASKTQTAALAALVASKAEDGKDDEDEDEKEAKEHSKGRAATLIERAKKLLAKAEDEEEKEDDEDDDGKAKAHRKAARGFKRRAAALLGKAQVHALAAADADLKKSIRLIAAKADIVVKAEDEDDDDEKDEKEAEKARAAAAAAAKAEADKNADGNQADKQDKESGNQSDSAKAVAAMQGKVDEALKGLTTLQGSVSSLMDAIAGRSRSAPGGNAGGAAARPDLFEFVKADPKGALATLRVDIDKAIDAGALDGNQQMHAMNLLAKVDAFHRGVIAKSVVDGMLATAPTAVRQIFEKAA